MTLTKNSVVRLSIDDINNLGYGVARHDGMKVFVSGAVDGDECDVKIIKVNKNYCIGKVENIVRGSVHRQTPECPQAKSCGGCSYQSISYEHELEIKKNYVQNAFARAGLCDIKVNDTISDQKIHGYRNKAQYPIAYEDGRYKIGFYASKSHRVIDSGGCTLQPKRFAAVTECLKEFFSRYRLSVYDEQSGKGLLRHIYLRSDSTGESVMLCLVINGTTTDHDAELVEYVRGKLAYVSTVMLNVNTKNTNVVLGDEYITLFGDGYIKDVMCGVELEISPAAFYQVNHDMAELLYKKAAELARLEKGQTVYDIYCGIGSIGLSMHEYASKVVGVDIEPSAIECAKRNAKECGIKNAHFFCADASKSEELFESAGIREGIEDAVVIFDPPRKGSSEKLISYICKKNPLRVVYISCNPDTLARDCTYFSKYGYITDEVTPFDLFPRTGHVESVVCLTRQTN